MFETLSPAAQLAIISGLLFIIIGSPSLYMLVDRLARPLNIDVADPSGRPSRLGLVLHAVVYALALNAYLMYSA
jgi:hypothetical protein